MADSANKLARLKALKSGLNAKRDSPAEQNVDSASSIDAMLNGEGATAPRSSTAPAAEQKAAPVKAVDVSAKDDDPESLSAYFEALGIVPDNTKVAPVAKPSAPAAVSDEPKPEPKTQAAASAAPMSEKPPAQQGKGREVDARDRWADPVREDDAFLSSFAGKDVAQDGEEQSLDSLISGFGEDEPKSTAKVSPEPETRPEEVSRVKTPPKVEPEPAPAPELEPEIPDPVIEMNDIIDNDEEPEDFGGDIDIEAFEREIARAQRNKTQQSPPVSEPVEEEAPESAAAVDPTPDPDPALDTAAEGALSVHFDAGRSAMLEQVSQQMGCTVDDVVITAVDWYLDALFGEDGSMQEAGAAE